MFSLFHSQSDEDAGSDVDGADIPSVVLPTPSTPAPPVAAVPLVAEVNAILSGENYFIIIVNSNSIQQLVSVRSYCH